MVTLREIGTGRLPRAATIVCLALAAVAEAGDQLVNRLRLVAGGLEFTAELKGTVHDQAQERRNTTGA